MGRIHNFISPACYKTLDQNTPFKVHENTDKVECPCGKKKADRHGQALFDLLFLQAHLGSKEAALNHTIPALLHYQEKNRGTQDIGGRERPYLHSDREKIMDPKTPGLSK